MEVEKQHVVKAIHSWVSSAEIKIVVTEEDFTRMPKRCGIIFFIINRGVDPGGSLHRETPQGSGRGCEQWLEADCCL
jgi:hypothetical protein